MHADDVCAFQEGGGHGSQAGVKAIFDGGGLAVRVSEDAAEERLSRGSN